MPIPGMLTRSQLPPATGIARSGLLEMISQRSRQAMPGSTGVGEDTTVSVGVGGTFVDVAVGGTTSVSVGSGALVGGEVAVEVGIGVSVGDFKAAMSCGDVVISVTTMVPMTPIIAARTVGFEKDFFVSSSEPDFLLLRFNS